MQRSPRQRQRAQRHVQWAPLRPDIRKPMTEGQIAAQIAMAQRVRPDVGAEQIRAIILEEAEAFEMFSNDRYVVHRRRFLGGPGGQMPLVHLSIRRRDRAPVRDWRDMQRIKNELVGPECEGIELYPAESRLMDTANQFHLWVIDDPNIRFPFGYDDGRTVSSESGGGSVQRPLDERAA